MPNAKKGERQAVLRSAVRPTEKQMERFKGFLLRKYGEEIPLCWEADEKLKGGFRLHVGEDIYDWSIEGRMRQFHEYLSKLRLGSDSVIPLVQEAVENWTPEALAEESGVVLTVGDEIAVVSGLEHVRTARSCCSTPACAAWCRTSSATRSAASCSATAR